MKFKNSLKKRRRKRVKMLQPKRVAATKIRMRTKVARKMMKKKRKKKLMKEKIVMSVPPSLNIRKTLLWRFLGSSLLVQSPASSILSTSS